MKTPEFNNGDQVKCRVTGLKGIVVAVTTWFNGCIRYIVQPQEIKDGKPVDTSSFDENDLELVKASKVESAPVRKTGGPQSGDRTASRRF